MSINCLNLSSVNGEILIETKEKKKRTGETLRQCYNTVMKKQRSVLGKDIYKSVNLSSFRIKYFKVVF